MGETKRRTYKMLTHDHSKTVNGAEKIALEIYKSLERGSG